MKLKLHSLLFSTFVFLLFSAEQNNLSAQAQVVWSLTKTYMVMSGGTSTAPIYLVNDNTATNAFTNASNSNGYIISEGQYRYVKWNTGTVANTYVYPFGYSTTDYIPVTFSKGVTASNALVSASTWNTPSNNTAWAGISDGGTVAAVANMTCPLQADCSIPVVIDRWWDFYTGGVATTANVTFSYRGAENTMQVPDNTATLGCQHWTGTVWNDGKGGAAGSTTTTSSNGGITLGTVYTAGPVLGLNQFSPFILGSLSIPLPVEWLDVSAECSSGNVLIKWSTASEQNSSYFEVEHSLDGTNFSVIATKPAGGNTSTIQNYSAIDTDPYSGISFYRIAEVDFNGAKIYSAIVTVNGCAGDDVIIYGEDGGAAVNINASVDGQYTIEMYNVLGQKTTGQIANVTAGNNHIKLSPNNVASAIYVVKVYNNNNIVTKKVFIRSKI